MILGGIQANDHGASIYKKQCMECHGPKGESVAGKTEHPLSGLRTIESLAGRIERTMPEDRPEACVGPDARAVAEYIYHAFYSVEARNRLTPARIEVTHLTHPQYLHSVMDLVDSFRSTHFSEFKDERGLKASYAFHSLEGSKEERDKAIPFQRVDARIAFNFEGRSPDAPVIAVKKAPSQQKPAEKDQGTAPQKEDPEVPVKLDPDRFKISWQGSVIAEETGFYQFVLRTRNGAELWINERNGETSATIDGYVAPDNEVRDLSKEIFLVAGRAYPLQLDFFKRTNQKEGKKAEITLLWKPPHGTLEPIPERSLLPGKAQEYFVPVVNFPADDRSVGYERGTSVSRPWLDALQDGALQAADYVVEHLDELARTKKGDPDRDKKIQEFSRLFLARSQRATRLSPTGEELFDRILAGSDTSEGLARKAVIWALTSPGFLYPKISEESLSEQERVVSRLALALWDSLPTPTLQKKAAEGFYKEASRIDQLTWEMMKNPRTKAKLHLFFHHWLELDRATDLAKSESAFPQFSAETMADLRASIFQFIDEIVWSKESDYRQLLTSDSLYLNDALASVYASGVKITGKDLKKVALPKEGRSGILTHPYLLTTLAYHDSTSPIHRGVFLSRRILGLALKSPPMANQFLAAQFDPSLTMREKVTELTKSENCMGCHATINPLGFSLEQFDGIGRWRNTDQGKPIDASGLLKMDGSHDLSLTSAADVADFAVTQRSAHLAFVENLFHHTIKQPAAAYAPDRLNWLCDSFARQEFSILDLLKQIAFTSATEDISPSGSSTKVAVLNPSSLNSTP